MSNDKYDATFAPNLGSKRASEEPYQAGELTEFERDRLLAKVRDRRDRTALRDDDYNGHTPDYFEETDEGDDQPEVDTSPNGGFRDPITAPSHHVHTGVGISIPNPPSLVRANAPYKEVGVAYALFIFLSLIGAHKFYLGRVGLGIAYIFTLGFFGVGILIDAFTLAEQTRRANAKIHARVRENYSRS